MGKSAERASAEDGDQDTDNGFGTADVQLFSQVSGDHFEHGNGRGDCRQKQQREKCDSDVISTGHLGEDVGQGQEDQFWS